MGSGHRPDWNRENVGFPSWLRNSLPKLQGRKGTGDLPGNSEHSPEVACFKTLTAIGFSFCQQKELPGEAKKPISINLKELHYMTHERELIFL